MENIFHCYKSRKSHIASLRHRYLHAFKINWYSNFSFTEMKLEYVYMLANYQGKIAAIEKLKDIMNDVQSSKSTVSFNEIRYVTLVYYMLHWLFCIFLKVFCFKPVPCQFFLSSVLIGHRLLRCSTFLKLVIHFWFLVHFWLTSWGRALLEKLIVSQLVKFPAVYGSWS